MPCLPDTHAHWSILHGNYIPTNNSFINEAGAINLIMYIEIRIL